eukprot:TRINITY_DN1152_c0_g1_i14.p1 TRINITY_DN1152_c0_g1~~TRINITY_DN1152_c0_g1_i14.p1  ORF type:complete len:346 (-),score=135.84 TRINITY_DN1152_c0_g1_i14:721-1758(-)
MSERIEIESAETDVNVRSVSEEMSEEVSVGEVTVEEKEDEKKPETVETVAVMGMNDDDGTVEIDDDGSDGSEEGMDETVSELEPLSSSAHIEPLSDELQAKRKEGLKDDPTSNVVTTQLKKVVVTDPGIQEDERYPFTVKIVSDNRYTIRELLERNDVDPLEVKSVWCQFAYDYNQASLGIEAELLFEHKETGKRFQMHGYEVRELLEIDHDNYVQFYGVYDTDVSDYNVYLYAFNTDFVVLPGDAVIVDVFVSPLEVSKVDLEDTEYFPEEFLMGITEVLQRVFAYLDAESLLACTAVCKYWREILLESEDDLWETVCQRESLWQMKYKYGGTSFKDQPQYFDE